MLGHRGQEAEALRARQQSLLTLLIDRDPNDNHGDEHIDSVSEMRADGSSLSLASLHPDISVNLLTRLPDSHSLQQVCDPQMNDPGPIDSQRSASIIEIEAMYLIGASENSMVDAEMPHRDPGSKTILQSLDSHFSHVEILPHLKADKFRYCVTLNAPTSMVKSLVDFPITYLNKGQAYSLSIIDTTLPRVKYIRPTYRTSVRICFDDEAQRDRPTQCWNLWKEGGGNHEAQQYSRRFKGVEYVDSVNCSSPITAAKALVTLDSESIDGFVIKWSPIGEGPSECSLAVCFHFLSADFTRTKGVKRFSMRLCVKTEMISHPNHSLPLEINSEICYTKVQLFRNHGAETKFSDDTTHVMNLIKKVTEEIIQIESGSKQGGMEKKNEPSHSNISNATADTTSRNKRTWSISFGDRKENFDQNEDPFSKLAILQDMLTSPQPATILFLRADRLDDPDLYPISFSNFHEDTKAERDERDERGRTVSKLSFSFSSAGSYSSRASSPPRTSSTAFDKTQIIPSLIPFEDDDLLPNTGQNTPERSSSPLAPSGGEYRYLPMKPDDVRLLALVQGTYEEDIHCALRILPISRLEGSQLGYQALSYAWGDESACKQIFLQDIDIHKDRVNQNWMDQMAPRKFLIRSNLYAALKRVRSPTEDLWFWIDALCINQNDDTEKSNQLPKMLDIFCNAWNVCIWLGEMDPINDRRHAHGVLDIISTIVNLKLFDRIVASEDPDEDMAASFVAFANILRRSWFRRRWVIQEIAASGRASVQCGGQKVNWIDFADAVQLFVTKLDRIKALYASSNAFKQEPGALAHVESMGAGAIIRATDNVLRKSETGKVVARLWDIEHLVSTFVDFDASNPRDTIYALLPLARDGHLSTSQSTLHNIPSLDPDYSKPTPQIYAEFVRHCVMSSSSLDVICRHWALPLKEPRPRVPEPVSKSSYLHNRRAGPAIPSWVGLVTDSTFESSANEGSFVGKPGRAIYNASRGRPADVSFSDFTLSSDGNQEMSTDIHSQVGRYSCSLHKLTLYAKGFRLAPIQQVAPCTVDGIIPYDGLHLVGWSRNTDMHTIPDHLWRILVADRGSDGLKAPSWWRRACMNCLSKTSRDGDLNTTKLIDHNALPEIVLEYLRRVQAVMWNRKLFACAKSLAGTEGLLGLGPSHTRGGDWACILFGCSVPVILREHMSDKNTRHFEFIGECYIYGMMDGEASALLDKRQTNTTVKFNIQ